MISLKESIPIIEEKIKKLQEIYFKIRPNEENKILGVKVYLLF
jgi:hypothetical protein